MFLMTSPNYPKMAPPLISTVFDTFRPINTSEVVGQLQLRSQMIAELYFFTCATVIGCQNQISWRKNRLNATPVITLSVI